MPFFGPTHYDTFGGFGPGMTIYWAKTAAAILAVAGVATLAIEGIPDFGQKPCQVTSDFSTQIARHPGDRIHISSKDGKCIVSGVIASPN